MKKIKLTIIILVSLITFVLTSCESKVRAFNINGTYKGQSAMGYEAVVENGTITIYSTSFFEKEVYWYGTCHANELDSENTLVSKRLEGERSNDIFGFGFGFGSSINESRAREKAIKFTEDSLTFIYDFSGMSVSQVTLYKEIVKKKYNEFDSNAEKLDPNYETPTIPIPGPPGQTERPTEPSTEAPTTKRNDNIAPPSGENYSL